MAPIGGPNSPFSAEQYATYVLQHIERQAALLASGATLIAVTGKSAHVPRLLSSGTSSWVRELEQIPSSAPDADDLVLRPKALKNLVNLSNESIADSSVSTLDTVGTAMTRASARAIDLQAFSSNPGTDISPAGLLDASNALPSAVGVANIATIRARIAALVALGARPNAVYVSGADYAALDAENDADGRGLLEPNPQVPGATMIAGCHLHVVPLAAGWAIVAEAAQILVGLRKDASVELSKHAGWGNDSTSARVVVRVDFKVNDAAGLSVIKPV
jgi:HK97 family phage major capsid protein